MQYIDWFGGSSRERISTFEYNGGEHSYRKFGICEALWIQILPKKVNFFKILMHIFVLAILILQIQLNSSFFISTTVDIQKGTFI